MLLSEALKNLNILEIKGKIDNKSINSICYDSRKANENSLFVAIKGFADDGHKYIAQALDKGATAIIYEDESYIRSLSNFEERVFIKVTNSRKALSIVSQNFFGNPTSKLKLIGITGTKGKTTTAFLIKNLLEYAGVKCGLIGTIANYIGKEKIKSSLTTPESYDACELLNAMVENDCKAAVMEVSSHSLELGRVYSFNFFSGVFTNITSDHMDFHKTFENYLNAKKKLFDSLSKDSYAIINVDDPNGYDIIRDCNAKVLRYSSKDKNCDLYLRNIEFSLDGTKFVVEYKGKSYDVFINLVGDFNAYNAAAAFLVCLAFGLSPESIIEGLRKSEQVPGRFQKIANDRKTVIIDYAHTADSLEKTLLAIRKISKQSNKIYTVFGCGGNRDRTKRPIMGEIAARLSDYVVVTSDNPRFEEPEEIINEITAGIKTNNYKIEADREQAIKWAIENSENDAIILVAGKGHEDYQIIKDKRIRFSDEEIARKYLG